MAFDPRGSLARSALALLAGVATLTVISFAIEALNIPGRLFMFGYGCLSVAAGGFVTAWLARRAPLLHAALLGVLQALLTIWAAIAMPEHASAWTWATTVLMSPPAAIVGGWLYRRRRRAVSA